MIVEPARRVRRVSIRAPDDGLARRGAVLLEDALHTASLPADSGRVVFIRRLEVGTLHPHQSPASVALTVERRVAALAQGAIHAGDPAADGHAAVYFRDAIEPFVALARRVAGGQPSGAWFWPLAVRSWRPAMPVDEALRVTLFGALETGGVPAVAAVIEGLAHDGRTTPLLSALRWSDGPAMLRAAGWTPPVPGQTALPGVEAPLPRAWQSLVGQGAARWGASDARSLWLAGVALVATQASRLLDPRLMARAQRTIDQAAAPPSNRHVAAPTAVKPPGESYLRAGNAPADEASEASSGPEGEGDHKRTDGAPPAGGIDWLSQTAADDAPAEAQGSSIEEERSPVTDPAPLWIGEPRRTAHGGLWFLLPVLVRLHMARFLETYPDLIERDFPAHVLRHMARWLGIPADDPVLTALPPIASGGEAMSLERGDYAMPAVWADLSALLAQRDKASGAGGRSLPSSRPWQVHRVAGRPGVRVLADGYGVWGLTRGIWRASSPPWVRNYLSGNTVRRGATLPAAPDVDLLSQAWLIAARRWCRRYAGMGLRAIAARPGRVATTRTHVDVYFRPSQADVRVRRAGLDVDPGWVPWLGRVVTFHYGETEPEGETDGE